MRPQGGATTFGTTRCFLQWYIHSRILKSSQPPDPLRDPCHALERHFVIYQLLDSPQTSVRDILNKMGGLNLPLTSSASSIWRHIRSMNILCRETIKRPQLAKRHIKDRLSFSNLPCDDPRFTLPWFFSDECSVELNPYRTDTYRVPGITTAQGIYQDYAKHPIRVMVSEGIAPDYKSELLRGDGNMNT
jgi:hypothetical protein